MSEETKKTKKVSTEKVTKKKVTPKAKVKAIDPISASEVNGTILQTKIDTPKGGGLCNHSDKSKVAEIGSIVPNKFLKPINGKIIWHIDENYLSQDMEKYKIVYAFSQAFAKWYDYMSPIVFEATGDITKAQIVIKFMVNGTVGLPIPFDSGVLAYTYAPDGESFGIYSDMFINDAYKWNDMLTEDSILLFNVVVHELLHAIGAGHSTDKVDIMYPYYQPTKTVTVTKDTQRWIYSNYKNYGVANPDPQVSNNTLSIKELFSSKADLARLTLRQLTVIANFVNVTVNSNDKFQAIVNKVYSKIYA